MRCTAYCTAVGYDISRLYSSSGLARNFNPKGMYRDVVHVQFKEGSGAKGDIFYFPYGVVIFWGCSEEEEKESLAWLKQFEEESLAKPELDEFRFDYADKMSIEEDEIFLKKKDPISKLAVSYAIAQSVKLTVFEEAIAKTVAQTRHLPENLANRGKIALSRKETSQRMGEIFLERNYINLHVEILDTPEFFWEHAEAEPLYRKMIHYLDMNKRVDLLNRRLKLLHELFEILGNELNHRHSSRLEITIVLLIVIEVAIAVMRDLLHCI